MRRVANCYIRLHCDHVSLSDDDDDDDVDKRCHGYDSITPSHAAALLFICSLSYSCNRWKTAVCRIGSTSCTPIDV